MMWIYLTPAKAVVAGGFDFTLQQRSASKALGLRVRP